jgi:hypothetical protein
MRTLRLFGLIICTQACGQGSFQNLNFESTTVLSLPSGQTTTVSTLDGLPGWTAYLGGSQTSAILHNGITLGDASISILGPSWNGFQATIIDGNYSAALKAGDLNGDQLSASIEQTGMVPPDAKSIQLKVQPFAFNYLFGVSLGSQSIPMVVLSQRGNILLLGGDVSNYAGKLEELRLSSINTPNTPFGAVTVDDIVFSSQPIPEPSTTALLIAALLASLAFIRIRFHGANYPTAANPASVGSQTPLPRPA